MIATMMFSPRDLQRMTDERRDRLAGQWGRRRTRRHRNGERTASAAAGSQPGPAAARLPAQREPGQEAGRVESGHVPDVREEDAAVPARDHR